MRDIAIRKDIHFIPFQQTPAQGYFDVRARPRFVAELPDRKVLVIVDTILDPSILKPENFVKEFFRNIAAAPSFFDYVFVYASVWMDHAEIVKKKTTKSAGGKIIMIRGDDRHSPRQMSQQHK